MLHSVLRIGSVVEAVLLRTSLDVCGLSNQLEFFKVARVPRLTLQDDISESLRVVFDRLETEPFQLSPRLLIPLVVVRVIDSLLLQILVLQLLLPAELDVSEGCDAYGSEVDVPAHELDDGDGYAHMHHHTDDHSHVLEASIVRHLIQHEHYEKSQVEEYLNHDADAGGEENTVVVCPDTVVEPHAVMVEFVAAPITGLAVFAEVPNPHVTVVAVAFESLLNLLYLLLVFPVESLEVDALVRRITHHAQESEHKSRY